MATFGVGEILGCFFIGFFIDRIGSKKSSLINSFLVVLMGISAIIFIKIADFDIYLAHTMCFFWGL